MNGYIEISGARLDIRFSLELVGTYDCCWLFFSLHFVFGFGEFFCKKMVLKKF